MAVGLSISPGVYTKIIDLSGYLQAVAGTVAFCAFFSRKGPDNQLKHITSLQQFADLYGRPNINDYGKQFGQGTYVAWNHIAVSPSFYCMRVLPDAAEGIDSATFSNTVLYLNTDTTAQVIAEHCPEDLVSIAKVNEMIGRQGRWNGELGEYVYDDLTDLENWSSSGDTTHGRPFVMFYPVGRGDYYDNIGLTIERHSNVNLPDPDAPSWQRYYVVNVYEAQPDGSDQIIESFTVSFDVDGTDQLGGSVWIEDIINNYSKVLRCIVNREVLEEWVDAGAPEISIGLGGLEIQHLYGGSEGSLVTVTSTGKRKIDSSVATQQLVEAYLGLKDANVLETDNIYFPVVYDAGYPTDVKEAIVTLASEYRMDCVAILDNGDNVSYDMAIASRTNNNNFNTKYAAVYEEFSRVYDVHTGKDIWVTPVYHIASMLPLNDYLYKIWFPSAGFNRATISDIKELRFSPKQIQRDYFTLNQINPIVKFSIGYVVWGNLTTQKKPSALQDLSIMRTILYIQRALEQFCRYYVFELNNSSTWQDIKNNISPFLEEVKAAGGLESFTIDVGATEYEKKTKRVHVNITLVPTRIIERIELNLYVK